MPGCTGYGDDVGGEGQHDSGGSRSGCDDQHEGPSHTYIYFGLEAQRPKRHLDFDGSSISLLTEPSKMVYNLLVVSQSNRLC